MTIDRMIEITLDAITAAKIGRDLAAGENNQDSERACEDTIEELNQLLGALGMLAMSDNAEPRS